MNGIGFDELNKAKKNDFTENKPEEDKHQALVDNCTRVGKNMSLSRFSIFKSIIEMEGKALRK